MLFYVIWRTLTHTIVGYIVLSFGLDYGGLPGICLALVGLFLLASAGFTVYRYIGLQINKFQQKSRTYVEKVVNPEEAE